MLFVIILSSRFIAHWHLVSGESPPPLPPKIKYTLSASAFKISKTHQYYVDSTHAKPS